MTTAPDLPVPVAPGAIPAQPQPVDPRPPLALVPPLAPSRPGEPLDLDEALRAATPRLQRYAARRLHDPHEAEEVVQEALLRAFQHKETFATEDDLMAWLTVVTGRLTIDRLRVRGRSTPVAELPATCRTGRDTADVVVARDEARIALDALEAMPSRQAAVLWAREVEGLSYDEIGDRYGLSEPTVRSLLHRARRTLRREYAERGGTFPAVGLVALAPWLHGLRLLGRLRHVAKRTSVAAAATGAGLAIATVAPLWSSPAPAHAQAAPMAPYVAKAQEHTLSATPHHAVARPATHASVQHAAAPTSDTTVLAALPRACTKSGAGAGCQAAPTKPMLFVRLPNKQDVGVETDMVPVDCTQLPSTTLTHCELNDRKNS